MHLKCCIRQNFDQDGSCGIDRNMSLRRMLSGATASKPHPPYSGTGSFRAWIE